MKMNTENEILVKKKFNSSNMYGSKFSKEKAKMASSSEALSKIVLVQNTFNKMVEVFLTLFYMGGGNNVPPLVNYRSAIVDGCPKLADFS